jgi:PhnB protein
MEAIVPYLNFNGNALEALTFYGKALDGSIIFSQKFGDAPSGVEDNPAVKDQIMHATFKAGDLTIMASDTAGRYNATAGTNVSLSLNFTDDASMDKAFNGLAEGGTVTMPLQDTFWGARFGMLTDKFGFHWMFNHDKQPKDK